MSATQLLDALTREGMKLIVAESLTGGALASALVSVPGASAVFAGGVVAYDSDLKVLLLGVDRQVLDRAGPVSLEVATQMATGAKALLENSIGMNHPVLAISTTGVAGPTQQGQPVGKVFIGLAIGDQVVGFEHDFVGDRAVIREASVQQAIAHALDLFS